METAPPNHYAQKPPAWPNRGNTAKQLHSRPLSVDKRRPRNQTATLTAPQRSQTEKPSPNGYAENSRPLISIHLRPFPSSFSLPCPSVFLSRRSQTETAPPNHYAHGSSAWTSGDGVTKELHSGPVNVDRWRQHRRNTTLRAPQHSQMELTPPNHYAGYRPESRKRLGGIPENPGIPEPPDRPAQRTRAPEPDGSSGTQRNLTESTCARRAATA